MEAAGSTDTKEVAAELPRLIRVYKDGTVERLFGYPIVPPSPQDPETGVSSKDITISQDPLVSARLFLPKLTDPPHPKKLPIFVYFHGGGFCLESACSSIHQRYLNFITARAAAVSVSVEYRRAPEHPLPAAYDDCWAALRWVAAHSDDPEAAASPKEPWLAERGDLRRLFIGGDSTGGNIVHNVAMRAGRERLPGGVRVLGAVLSQAFFWGSKAIGSEAVDGREEDLWTRLWRFVNAEGAGRDIDDPRVNPMVPGAPSLEGLGCERMLICAGEKDEMRDRNEAYRDAVKESGWGGAVEWLEVEGEGHAFHLARPESEKARLLIDRVASFMAGE